MWENSAGALRSVADYWKGMGRTKKAIAISVLFMALLFFAFKVAFWAVVFILVASMAEIYNNSFRTPLHFDLVKLGTILISAAYGAPAGIFVGLASTFFAKLFSMRLDVKILISFAGIVLIAILADAFSGAPITVLGISLVALYYLVTSPINLLLGEEPGYAFVYVISSLAVNFVLFTQVAPRIVPLLWS